MFHRLVDTLAAMTRTPSTAVGIVLAMAFAMTGCGEDRYANRERPPTKIVLSAVITPTGVTVSPARTGAGTIELIVSNLTSRSERLTLSSTTLGPGAAPLEQRTGPINPGDTASLTADLATGTYRLAARSRSVAAATLRVGPARPSSSDRLLQP